MVWITVAMLVGLAIAMYLVSELTKVEGTPGFTFSVYPWVTTLPETITTTLLAVSGYYTAAIYNSVFSAVFDLAVGLGLVAVIYGTTEFRLTDLTFLAAIAALAFIAADYDGYINMYDGATLLAILFILIGYSIAKYGMFRRRVTKYDLMNMAAGIVVLAILGFLYYQYVEQLIPYVGEKLGGIVSATLTSIPDVIVAVVYGLGEPESQAELLGAVAHDFVENVPIAAIAAGLIAGRGIVDTNPMLTVAMTALTAATVVFVASYRRVTRFEGFILLMLFAVCCYVALL